MRPDRRTTTSEEEMETRSSEEEMTMGAGSSGRLSRAGSTSGVDSTSMLKFITGGISREGATGGNTAVRGICTADTGGATCV
ncbi:MAG: hypothetical protein ACK56F_27440, partial [bacterium]